MTGNELLQNRQEVMVKVRRGAVAISFVLGTLLVGLAISADSILNSTPRFGVVQMAQLLVGLSFLTLSGYLQIYTMRQPDAPRSLQADIGVRFGATGLVFCFAAGFADLLQIGTHTPCNDELVELAASCGAFIGPWQLIGIGIGILSIVSGLLLYYTSRGTRPVSLFGFLIKDEQPAS